MHEFLKFNEGDPGAFKAIHKLFVQQLILYALKYTIDKMVAEEIVQDSFLKAFEKCDQFEDLKDLRYYLYRITYNACIDYLRKNQSNKSNIDTYKYFIQNTAEVHGVVQLQKEQSEFIAFLMQLIQEQPLKRRQALEGLYIHNKEPKEVAELMDINVSGVYKHRDEFIKFLREEKKIDAKYLFLFGD